jgi:hypothetical protein
MENKMKAEATGMSDKELCKRLVDWSEHDEGKINDARQEAKLRIEALTEQLAKAVEALRAFKDFDDMPTSYKRPDVFEVSVRRKLLPTLAEIEGKKG